MPSNTLSWAANPATDNVLDYEVWGANGTSVAFGSCSKLATVTALTWTDVGLAAGQARTYYIRAVNAVGPSSPDGPYNITSAALSTAYVNNHGGAPSVQEGTHAARPAAGNAGAVYIETDTFLIFRDNGTSWDQVGGGSPANPSATASDTAVNGSAATFMRSDAAPAVQKATTGQFGLVKPDGTTITISGGVISSVGGGGGGSAITMPRGRLTLVTGTPILTSDQTAKTTIYYTPYIGSTIPLYNGSATADVAFTELTLTLDTTNHVSGSLYDVFVWNNSGTISVGTGPAWSSGTARGTGAGTTELQMLSGFWTNKNSITLKNGAGAGTTGVAANTALYVGTFYATANGQTGMAFTPTAAAGGTNNILGLWNAYNRVRTFSRSRDSTGSWTYNATTWRAANNSNSNRISYIDGLAQANVDGHCQIVIEAGGSVAGAIGMARDSTSATPDVDSGLFSSAYVTCVADQSWVPSLGFHYIQAMESAPAGTPTFLANETTPVRNHQALSVQLEM